MGVESAVYKARPRPGALLSDLTSYVETIGGRATGGNDWFDNYVLSSNEYWIDLQIAKRGGGAPYLSVRVAYCNPPMVVDLVTEHFALFLLQMGGVIVDTYAKTDYHILDATERAGLRAGYERRREEFVRVFGDFVAPISADDVFEYRRGLQRNE